MPPLSHPRLIVAQLGARMHYAVPRVLEQHGMLQRFYTDITGRSLLLKCLASLPFSPNGLKRLAGRVPAGVPRNIETTFPAFGWKYWKAVQATHTTEDGLAVHLWAGKHFCELVLNDIQWGNVDGVYTFNSAGLELLSKAKKHGKLAVIEQTIAPRTIQEDILRREYQQWPSWGAAEPDNKYTTAFIEREQEEWAISDVILCGSEFVKDSIAKCGGPADKCRIVPYGVDLKIDQVDNSEPHSGPLRVLFVGSVGMRKGMPYVLEAAKRLKDKAIFRVVGSPGNLSADILRELKTHVNLIGVVPRSGISEHYQWADVFILPSICEGSATVTYEAMSAGLPVVCTTNTGSVVSDGEDGFIVPVGDIDALITAVKRLCDDRSLLAEMRKRALLRSKDLTVEAYGVRLRKTLDVAWIEHN